MNNKLIDTVSSIAVGILVICIAAAIGAIVLALAYSLISWLI